MPAPLLDPDVMVSSRPRPRPAAKVLLGKTIHAERREAKVAREVDFVWKGRRVDEGLVLVVVVM